MAPYPGYIRLEKFRSLDGRDRIQVVVHGEVVSAFKAHLTQDCDGGYDLSDVQSWVPPHVKKRNLYRGCRIPFFDVQNMTQDGMSGPFA